MLDNPSRKVPLSPLPYGPYAHGWDGLYEDDTARATMFAAAVHELQNVGILCAVTCSTLNDLYRAGASNLPAHCITMMPPEPVVVSLLIETSRIWRMGPRLVPQIKQMTFYLDNARQLLTANTHCTVMPTPVGNVEFEALVDAWRAASGAIWTTFDVIECEPPVPLAAGVIPAMMKLKDFLARARDGGTPCLSEARGEYPSWAQRRQRVRALVNLRATACYGGVTRTILVRDASYGGLGLDYAPGLQVGVPIVLTLEGGRYFEAVVAWCHGERAGVKFPAELTADDPLLAGA